MQVEHKAHPYEEGLRPKPRPAERALRRVIDTGATFSSQAIGAFAVLPPPGIVEHGSDYARWRAGRASAAVRDRVGFSCTCASAL